MDGSGTYYFYAHLSGFAPGLQAGSTVRAGEIIADGTPDAIMRDAEADGMDQAFLTLVRRHQESTLPAPTERAPRHARQ